MLFDLAYLNYTDSVIVLMPDEINSQQVFRAGYIAIVGRPNVGKSSLINSLVNKKISIITPKPQTTRHRLLGIKTAENVQMIFVDTPGYHLGEKRAINQYMNRIALSALDDVDIILFVLESLKWTNEDNALLSKVTAKTPIVALVNKIDLVNEKEALLPFIAKLNELGKFSEIIPVSVKKKKGLDLLERYLEKHLPVGGPYFEEDQITDKSVRFICAERIREKIFLEIHQEIPYSVSVEIESFIEEDKIFKIAAIIWVERDNQKSIVIGEKGRALKKIGENARLSIESFLEKKVFLQLWVKVQSGWSNSNKDLQKFGYLE